VAGERPPVRIDAGALALREAPGIGAVEEVETLYSRERQADPQENTTPALIGGCVLPLSLLASPCPSMSASI
jgi:hypothetical protein